MLALCATGALAGPPYVTDDAEPTSAGHWEVNLFTSGAASKTASLEQFGVNASYGVLPDLELNATFASALDQTAARDAAGLTDLQIGAKYKFLHQEEDFVDVAVVPGLSLPTHSDHALGFNGVVPSLALQFEKDGDEWSVFGGGGCNFPGDNLSQDFCLFGAAATWQVSPTLQLGAEVYRVTPGARHAEQATNIGLGAVYDLSEHYHLLASLGPGVQNTSQTSAYAWYFALQVTE